ncbi:hypothetical protein SCA6_015400 [Theobroma cacao]
MNVEIMSGSEFNILESFQCYLLDDFEESQAAAATTTTSNLVVLEPSYNRSSSFSGIFLNESWGDLPLKIDDSEDMLVYSALRDAANSGWSPSNEVDNYTPVAVEELVSTTTREIEKEESKVEPETSPIRVGGRRRSPESSAPTTASSLSDCSRKRRKSSASNSDQVTAKLREGASLAAEVIQMTTPWTLGDQFWII